MKTQEMGNGSNWIEEFENLYITTYPALYRHGKLIFNQEETVKELLILVYIEAYQRDEQLQKEKSPLEWLMKRTDFLAETKLGASKDMLEASYAEEKMQSKEAKKENRPNLDETSLLLEIEDRLGIVDGPDGEGGENPPKVSPLRGVISLILLLAAMAAILFGAAKVRHQIDVLKAPFRETFADSSQLEAQMEEQAKKNRVQVGEKVVYLSDIGKVLYTQSLEETDLAGADPECAEIQKMNGWTYYLPCPEREDSQLSQVQPTLYHTLYRMRSDGTQIEIIREEVDAYTVCEQGIYVSQYGRIQSIDPNARFETIVPGNYAKVDDNEIYLYDMLGRTLKTESDGSIRMGDRIYEMSSNRILDVRSSYQTEDGTSYSLKETEEGGMAIYSSRNGVETLAEKKGQTIDSFCIAGNWLYYSAFVRRGGSGAHYSQLYRRSLTDPEGEAELLGEEFTGRIRQMYFVEESELIYANYTAKSWESNYGVIAVISLSGQMTLLDDEEQRQEEETTGDDFLEFVLAQDGDIYCYWKDCYWTRDEEPVVIWRKVLVIPEDEREVSDGVKD